jgi:ubiquitin carboxyl-terminal hydrolase 22/27/51
MKHYLSCDHFYIKDVEFAGTIYSKLVQFNRFPNGKIHTCLTCSRVDSKLVQVEMRSHFEQTQHTSFMKVSRPCELFCMICGDYQFCSLFDNKTGRKREMPNLENVPEAAIPKAPRLEEKVELPSSHELVAKGLVNMGSTCFMNSSLQVLCHLNDFSGAKQLAAHYENCPITNKSLQPATNEQSSETSSAANTCIPCEFYKLYRELRFQNEDNNSVVPAPLLYAIWNLIDYMVGYAQQDAHEFLLALLNGVECQIKIENVPYQGEVIDKVGKVYHFSKNLYLL